MTAILLTGNYRSFDKTYYLINKNLIEPNQAKIFVYCEDKNVEDIKSKILSKINQKFIGDVVVVEDCKTPEYLGILDYILKNKPAVSNDVFAVAQEKDHHLWSQKYLIESGTIIQYYQFLKCYLMMVDYERQHNYIFKYCIRSRLDIIVGETIDLNNFFTTIDKNIVKNQQLTDEAYIRSLGLPSLYKQCQETPKRYDLNFYKDDNYHLSEYKKDNNDQHLLNLLNKINKTDYLWTLGIDQVWLGRRRVFTNLFSSIYFFGDYVDHNNPCTFNSETFFVHHLQKLNIKHLMYVSADIFNESYKNKQDVITETSSLITIIR